MKPVLTICVTAGPRGTFMARGISEDRTIFMNLLYTNLNYLIDRLGRDYSRRYRVVFNVPKEPT